MGVIKAIPRPEVSQSSGGLPASFLAAGFKPHGQARKKVRLPNGRFLKPVMIGTEGESDTGKSEFILSCPGPGIIICVDRGLDPIFDNPEPPVSRREDFGIKYVEPPQGLAVGVPSSQEQYVKYFKETRQALYESLDLSEALTIAVDGDSDFWELQVLAEFGKKTQIWPQTRWGDVYAKRRAITARCHDSGKIIIATNKVKDQYEDVLNEDGTPKMESDGTTPVRRKTGSYERQGFRDQTYLWNIQIRHLFKPAHIVTSKKGEEIHKPKEWGLRILKCKVNKDLEGLELWGKDCNFRGLVDLVYPDVDPRDWGFAE